MTVIFNGLLNQTSISIRLTDYLGIISSLNMSSTFLESFVAYFVISATAESKMHTLPTLRLSSPSNMAAVETKDALSRPDHQETLILFVYNDLFGSNVHGK